MAIHEIVLDPDGDMLVIVPGTPTPEGQTKDTGPLTPKSSGSDPEAAEAAPAEPPDNSEVTEPSASAPPEEEQWRFKASSKHLALASTYVKKMMSGPWREANEIHDEDELLHWTLDGFDVNAIAIILRIIHGLNRQVLRTIDLGMLAQVSRVVDYLECHEAIELYASIWVAYLNGLPPTSLQHVDWDSWISVTGVFQNPEIFRRWTRVAIVEKLNCPPSLELPILSQAYDTIDERRQAHLDKILACVYSHVDRLSEQKTCSAECDAILLGTLIRQLHANSLSALRPSRPYEGLSISSVVKTIRGLTVPEWYSKVNVVDEPSPSPFEFWGAPRKISKMQQKKAKLKSKKKTPPSDEWGVSFDPAREVDDMDDVMVNEHSCGFDDLIATVNRLEAEIQGLDLEADLGIRRED
ncbi:hypothetical protein GGR51DRAFT_373194 [Nemania sp. FL0031]|nr:hypothetical protein GGR51DRAFT_373194 [Nemania sp. FL0031]